jgi:hypothetical protein
MLVLGQLLASIEVAKKISPDAWALTLFRNGFRLNVGPVEVMTFYGDKINSQERESVKNVQLRVLLQGQINGSLKPEEEEGEVIYPAPYKSVPQPQFCYINNGVLSDGELSKDKFQRLEYALSSLQPAHERFISFAAKTSSGKIRSASNYSHTHSLGLYSYAESFVHGNLEAIGAEDAEPLLEGKIFTNHATVYERNPAARRQCIEHYGLSCIICGFNFNATYGNASKNYIEVHHLTPISAIGEEHNIDPIRDLRPVCSNCHSVIHLHYPPYSIQEVKDMLRAKLEIKDE